MSPFSGVSRRLSVLTRVTQTQLQRWELKPRSTGIFHCDLGGNPGTQKDLQDNKGSVTPSMFISRRAGTVSQEGISADGQRKV